MEGCSRVSDSRSESGKSAAGDTDKVRRKLLKAAIYMAPTVVASVFVGTAHAQAFSCAPSFPCMPTGFCMPDGFCMPNGFCMPDNPFCMPDFG